MTYYELPINTTGIISAPLSGVPVYGFQIPVALEAECIALGGAVDGFLCCAYTPGGTPLAYGWESGRWVHVNANISVGLQYLYFWAGANASA